MQFSRGKLNGTWIIQPKVFQDDRGYFFESYREENFLKNVGDIHFIQDNESKSTYGVLRGLHYQLPPFAQSKLVRVIEGSILDVAVDIRKSSETFRQTESVELSAENKKQFFIPKGFAHGFAVLSETAIVQYKVDAYYSKEHERGIRYDDMELGIDWQIDPGEMIISEKDSKLPSLQNADMFDEY
jgi:dTDP-4-dehydrorhamnose 3,5-epimerase